MSAMRIFPPSFNGILGYNDAFVAYMLRKLSREEGGEELVAAIKPALTDKNGMGGLMCMLFDGRLGIPNGINALEQNNKQPYERRKAKKKKKKSYKLPTLDEFITVMHDSVVPTRSRGLSKRMFERIPRMSEGSRNAHKQFTSEAGHLIIKIGDQLYAFREKTAFGSVRLCDLEVRDAFKTIECWNRGPPFTDEELEIMSEVKIVSPDSCWPCAEFMKKTMCYHVTGLRQRLHMRFDHLMNGPGDDEFRMVRRGKRLRDVHRRKKKK